MGGRKALERLYLTTVWKPLALVCLCMYHSHGDHVLFRLAWVTVVNCNVYLGKYLIFILDNIYAVTVAMDNKGRFSDDQLMDCLKRQTEKNIESSEEKKTKYEVQMSCGNDRTNISWILSHLQSLRGTPSSPPPLGHHLTL